MSAKKAERVRRVQEIRRSNAAAPHRNRRKYHRPTQSRATKQERS